MSPRVTSCYAVQFANGETRTVGDAPPSFTIRVPDENTLARLLGADLYSAAMSFVGGRADIHGGWGLSSRAAPDQPKTWAAS